MSKPERKVVLEIKLQADEWEDAARELEEIALIIIKDGGITSLISGGYSCGYIVEGRENPDQTHDNYAKENGDYVHSLKKEQP